MENNANEVPQGDHPSYDFFVKVRRGNGGVNKNSKKKCDEVVELKKAMKKLSDEMEIIINSMNSKKATISKLVAEVNDLKNQNITLMMEYNQQRRYST